MMRLCVAFLLAGLSSTTAAGDRAVAWQTDAFCISGSGARGRVNSDFARRIQKNAPKDHKRVFLLGIQNPFLFDKTKRKRGLGTHSFFVLQIVFAAAEKTVRRVRSAGTGETSRTTFFCRRQKKAFLGLRKKRRLEAPPEVPTNLSGAQTLNCLPVMRRCRWCAVVAAALGLPRAPAAVPQGGICILQRALRLFL